MSLYNLRTTGTALFQINKFTSDLDLESSYNVGASLCECPAGHLPRCRHRTMLPTLLPRVDTAWFWDFEASAWVDPTGEANKPATVNEDQVSSSLAQQGADAMAYMIEGVVLKAGSQVSYNPDPVERAIDNAIEVEEQLALRGAKPASAFKRRI